MRKECRAILKLVQRSVDSNNQSKLFTRGIATSARSLQTNQDPPNGKKGNDDDNKMPSMLAKAMLWMFTGYMLMTVLSLMFPGGNQPEVVR